MKKRLRSFNLTLTKWKMRYFDLSVQSMDSQIFVSMKKKTQFALVLSKLKNQLIFEGQQIEDTERKIQKIRVMLQEDLKTSEELLQAQNQYAQEREGALEGLKGQRKQLQEQRNGSETKNQSIKALKRDAAILLDDLIHLQKSVTSKVK
jgi:hypothetical protein